MVNKYCSGLKNLILVVKSEKERYLWSSCVIQADELRAHEVKSVSGGLEAPVQMIIIFYLIIRGLLPLPWSQPTSSSCIEDSLGRVACLPSIPVASIVFGFLCLVKSVFNLNIYPLVHHQPPSIQRMNITLNLCLTLMPCFISTAIFRISVLR